MLLLVLSNDKVMNLLGATWWKRLQRIAYLAFLLTVLHGFAFQALEARSIFLVGAMLAVLVGVLTLQVAGFMAVKKRAGQ